MTKNKLSKIFIIVGIIVILIATVLCIIFIPEPPPNKIYQNNMASIVELKADSPEGIESFGTAEFIDNNGQLVTNAHVVTYTRNGTVHAFEHYFIRFANQIDYHEAELVKYNTDLDIAVLRIKNTALFFSPIQIGNTKKIQSGDKVYAIGNSINYGLSISQGIVGIPLLNIQYSGITKSVIQCDLTITDGNSGGALLDNRGHLIGITTFRVKDNQGNVVYGIAYCIPINVVLEYVYCN